MIEKQKLIKVLIKKKISIILVITIGLIFGFFYSQTIEDRYRTEMLIQPVNNDPKAGLNAQVSGLAALTGVTLGGRQGYEKIVEATSLLTSKSFIAQVIKDNNYELDIYFDKYDQDWKLIVDPKKYNAEKSEWMVDENNKSFKPSYSRLSEVTVRKINVNTDKMTGLVSVSFESGSPYFAKIFIDNLVERINNDLKIKENYAIETSIDYLRKSIANEKQIEIRNSLYQILEEYMKKHILINDSNGKYLKILDESFIPEKRFYPNRIAITFSFGLLFGFISLFIFYLRVK